MTNLEKFEAVNKCKDFEEFKKVLLSFADETGIIQGRTRGFDAEKMARNAEFFYNNPTNQWSNPPNVVTREFGLRQQLMYLKYYNNKQ